MHEPMPASALQPFGQDLWTLEGPTVSVAGFDYPTRMAVIRLSGGSLFIWSPVAFTEDLRVPLAALGEVAVIVAPNSLHHRNQNSACPTP